VRLLDTDTCIEILRGNTAVVERRREVDDVIATSWITAAELHFGAARSARPEANARLVGEFLDTLPVIGLDGTAAAIFGSLKADLEKSGRRLADADLLIASISLSAGAVLVTGNRRHYARIASLRTESWIPR